MNFIFDVPTSTKKTNNVFCMWVISVSPCCGGGGDYQALDLVEGKCIEVPKCCLYNLTNSCNT
jgi:hypothetical protein